MVDPHIAAAAADAAIASLCEENSWPRDIFEDTDSGDNDLVKDEIHNPTTDVETKMRSYINFHCPNLTLSSRFLRIIILNF